MINQEIRIIIRIILNVGRGNEFLESGYQLSLQLRFESGEALCSLLGHLCIYLIAPLWEFSVLRYD